ncbi:unnamed protein product, partial [Mesorhabditis belari]|uniref:GPI ethanolamine phosphate transferase 2 C-terminal domain-containing protein n=1 Tax=Mesorhabditis belari TaxID=2138241 RepID=A0AAF3EEY4_9BILA
MRNAFVTVILSLLFFLYGFIPWDSVDKQTNEQLNESANETKCTEQLPVNKLILVVIDAWRLDFLTKRNTMSWMRNEIESRKADAFDVRVHTPTVTMPRIKALTSGTIPSFASVLLNFGGSREEKDDTWLRAANEAKKKIVFYGDDTWLSLFSEEFHRAKGVVSFFVKDYTEVDENVTQKIAHEFSDEFFPTWDILILHYLGLDHIGHSLGGNAKEIDEKLREMDSIVKGIGEKLEDFEQKDKSYTSAILVVGDHGMTEAGGHGGSSHLETHVPLFLRYSKQMRDAEKASNLAINFENLSLIDQVDIANLISNTLAIRPSKASLSAPVEHLIKSRDLSLIFPQFWIKSARSMLRLLEKQDKQIDDLKSCLDLLEAKQEKCETVSLPITAKCMAVLRETQNDLIVNDSPIQPITIIISATMICAQIILLFRMVLTKTRNSKNQLRFLFLTSILHFFSNFASSLVEEEHDLWYFFLSTALSLEFFFSQWPDFSAFSTRSIHLLLIAGIHRFCMCINADKRRRNLALKGTYPDAQIVDPKWLMEFGFQFFNRFKNFAVYILPAFSFYMIWKRSHRKLKDPMLFFFAFITTTLIPNVEEEIFKYYIYFVWAFAFVSTLLRKGFLLSTFLWMITLSGENEISIIFLCFCMGFLSSEHPILLVYLLPTSFFYLGNSNSLASVDIAVGYKGLASYQPFIVGLQIIIHSYSGPLSVLCGYVWK